MFDSTEDTMKRLLILFGILDAFLFLRFISQVYAPFRIVSSNASMIAISDSGL